MAPCRARRAVPCKIIADQRRPKTSGGIDSSRQARGSKVAGRKRLISSGRPVGGGRAAESNGSYPSFRLTVSRTTPRRKNVCRLIESAVSQPSRYRCTNRASSKQAEISPQYDRDPPDRSTQTHASCRAASHPNSFPYRTPADALGKLGTRVSSRANRRSGSLEMRGRQMAAIGATPVCQVEPATFVDRICELSQFKTVSQGHRPQRLRLTQAGPEPLGAQLAGRQRPGLSRGETSDKLSTAG